MQTSLPLRVQYENVIVCRHPAAAASFIQVSSCPGKPVLGFGTLSEQVQWIIFLCTSLLKAFASVIYLSILSFPLFPASGQDFDLSKLQRDTNRVLLSLMVKRVQSCTCGTSIHRSLSADSQLKFLSFREKGSRECTRLCVAVAASGFVVTFVQYRWWLIAAGVLAEFPCKWSWCHLEHNNSYII